MIQNKFNFSKITLLSALVLISYVFFSSFSHPLYACQSTPNNSEMDRLYHDWYASTILDGDIRLAFFPFQDDSLQEPDGVLQNGFMLTFYELLAQSVGVIHPFVVWDVALNSRNDLFDDEKVIPLAKNLKATHAVYGMFQRNKSGLRFFIKITDTQTGKMVVPPLEFQTPESDRYFSVVSDAAIAIMNAVGFKKAKLDVENFLKFRPRFEAFRYYVKGMLKSAHYHSIDLNLAKAWFEKAFQLSYNYNTALKEHARVLMMLAVYDKQMNKDASVYFGQARESLSRAGVVDQLMFGQTKQKSKKKKMNLPDHKRWTYSHISFANGLSSLKGGRINDALFYLKEATELLPEDGWAHYYYSQALKQKNNPLALTEMTKAQNISGCLN